MFDRTCFPHLSEHLASFQIISIVLLIRWLLHQSVLYKCFLPQEQVDDDCWAPREGAGGGHWERNRADHVATETARRVLSDQVRLGSARCSLHLGVWAWRHWSQYPCRRYSTIWGKPLGPDTTGPNILEDDTLPSEVSHFGLTPPVPISL